MRETIVLLPGLQSDHRSWVYQIEHLKTRYDVIVPGGHHALGSIPEMAKHVLRQVPKRFHLVAWSMGGYIALEMLPQLSGRLISLVLVGTSARPEDPANTERRLENLAMAEEEGMAAANDRSLAFSCRDVEALDPEVRSAIRQAAVDLGVEAYRAQQHAIIARSDGRRNLAMVDCPALIIVGDADEIAPPDRSQEMHAGIAGSKLVTLDKCGHCPPLEYPERFNALVDDWLSEQDRSMTLPAGAQ